MVGGWSEVCGGGGVREVRGLREVRVKGKGV